MSNEENNFITKNKKIWNKTNGEIGIIIEGFLYTPTSVIEKSRIAKAIEEKLNVKSLVLLRGFRKRSSNVYEIYKSFFIEDFIMWWTQYINIFLLSKTFFKTLFIYRKYPSGEELLDLKFDDILIGDLLYDTLIRFNPGVYTIRKLNFKNHFRHIFRTCYSAELYKRLFEKYDIKAVVTSHNVYAEYGMLCRLADKYNADVFLREMNVFKHYDGSIDINEHFVKIKYSDYLIALNDKKIIKKAEKYLQSRFNGTANQIDVKNAYRDKKTYTRKELFDYYQLKSIDNKCVFILAHAFSDAPHIGEDLLFNDYYHWLVETLKIITKVSGVNVFVKPHPSSYMYSETGVVEEILTKLDTKNIYILPKDFNTNSIKDMADYILTAQGTAGLEFSCFGIPAIIAGKGYYSGFDIAIEPNSREIYEKYINNILEIKELTDEQIYKAKIILYMSMQQLVRSDILPKNDIFPGDDYNKLYKGQYQEVANKLKNGIPMKDEFYQYIYEIAKDRKLDIV